MLFQFHYGSIGRFCRCPAVLSVYHFNSTMVRLEGARVFVRLSFTIISIPLWFDWKKLITFSKPEFLRISIPLWFDWKDTGALRCLLATSISIPLWFDWKTCSRRHDHRRGIHFNSTMVRLEVSTLKFDTACNYNFNSTMVRLEAAQSI